MWNSMNIRLTVLKQFHTDRRTDNGFNSRFAGLQMLQKTMRRHLGIPEFCCVSREFSRNAEVRHKYDYFVNPCFQGRQVGREKAQLHMHIRWLHVSPSSLDCKGNEQVKKEVSKESKMLEKSCSVKNFNTDPITNKIPFD